jgi:hypothetical protein
MKYCAKRNKGTATVLAVMLLILAAVCACFSSLGWGWTGIWQILTLISVVTVIQLGQRYILSGYEYIVDPLEELLSYNRLTVIRTVGGRRTSVFAEPLGGLVGVIPYRKTNALIAEYGRPVKRMDFCPDLFPSESYLLLFEVNGALSVVRLQCDATFAEELTKRMGV